MCGVVVWCAQEPASGIEAALLRSDAKEEPCGTPSSDSIGLDGKWIREWGCVALRADEPLPVNVLIRSQHPVTNTRYSSQNDFVCGKPFMKTPARR
eukprot:SAG22_NODE_11521_length_481_cov_0.534031_2_plen_95_part_01